MRKIVALILALSGSASLFAQEEKPAPRETFRPSHQLGITIGHEHAFSGRDENDERKVDILPFWGLDYNFRFAPKFSVGLHTDFIIESFKVEKNLDGGEAETVERTRPIAPAIMGFYKPTPHWSLGLGMGGEFAKEENYVLNRIAAEYGVEIRKGWEVAGSLQYDFRWQAYDTWTIGLGISKTFGSHKE